MSKSAVKPTVRKHVYENGLTLLVDEAPTLQSITIGAWVKTGSRNESLESWGMCHFLEHMMFKGKKNKGANAIAKAVDRVGGEFNAFTSREHTCYHFYLPAAELKLGAKLLKDILYDPLFDSKEIERERQVILQEVAMVKESPEEDAFDQLLERMFGKHPLGRQILGNQASISSITRKNLFHFFHQHYRPENMLIAVSGATSFEKARRCFSVLDGAWPKRELPLKYKTEWGLEPPERLQPGFWWVDSDTEQSHVLWSIPAPLETVQDRIASQLIQQHLGGGMSSVLFDEIREKKGWAYNVYANAMQFLDSSVFIVYAGVKPEKVKATLQVFRREMARIASVGIAAADLRRIKESLLNSFHLAMESSENRMMSIAHQELFFRKEFSFREYEQRLKQIRSRDLAELMSKWIQHGPPSILVLAPKPQKRDRAQFEKLSLGWTGNSLDLISSAEGS